MPGKLSFDVLGRIPRGVWVLGLVSLLMDVSSEMIHALLPIYLVTVLGASSAGRRRHRGHRRGDRLDHQDVLRRAVGLAGHDARCSPSSATGWRALTKPLFPLAAERSAGSWPRASSTASARASAARRATRWWPTCRRPRAARRELRPAPVARYGRRVPRAAAGDRR